MLTTSSTRQKFLPITASIVLTLLIWLFSKWQAGDWFANPYQYPAKAASLTATVMICWAVLLATRNRWLERYFGGLDKVYQIHKRLGKWSFRIILLHPFFLALDRLPDLPAFLQRFWFIVPSGNRYDLGHNLGVAALLLMVLLLTPTLWIRLPYDRWKRSHTWFGLFVLVAALHILAVNRDVAAYPLLRLWIWSLLILAAGSFITIRLLYPRFGPRYRYRVEQLERTADLLEITFQPEAAPMPFRPSQFVYLVVQHPKISPEPHPYSIACGYNHDARFKLGIKKLGDHTRSLDLLQPGDPVLVYGPYGHFSDRFLAAERGCVFIGGGIGITPFLGMWHLALHSGEQPLSAASGQALTECRPGYGGGWQSPLVSLFYLVPSDDQASFDNDIRAEVILSRFHGFPAFEERGHHYELWVDSRQGLISAAHIDSKVRGGVRDKLIFFCGPSPMVAALTSQFRALGVRDEQFVIEDFNLL